MSKLTELVKSGDFKGEKHVPSITVEAVDGGVKILAQVGEEIEHPNTLEHHIAWIKVFVKPEGSPVPFEVGSYQFAAHGEGEVFSKPEVTAHIKTDKHGEVYALSYCNIHGLWENTAEF
ncbi:MAG: desulfoferrodoxin family protein [Tissierellia bacterium]|nr:desulfoferrodoxin family protein [Tissierellia bacterium]